MVKAGKVKASAVEEADETPQPEESLAKAGKKLGKKKKASAVEEEDEQPEPEEAPQKTGEASKKKKKKASAIVEDDETPEAEQAPQKTGETSKKKKKHQDGNAEAPKKAKDEAGGKDALVQEVVQIIYKGITAPEAQKDGKAFVPTDWRVKYKDHLGAYKKFLQKHPDKFALIEDGAGNFIIKRPEDVDPNEQKNAPRLIKGKTWQKMLIDAWMAYCLAVPRDSRHFEQFIGTLPNSARNAKPEKAAAEATSKKKEKRPADGAEPTASEPPAKKGKKRKAEAAGDEDEDAGAPQSKKTKKQKQSSSSGLE